MDYKQYHDEIIKRNDVYKLGWRENGVESIREFDYTWKEQVLGEIQISKDIDNDELEAKRARQRN